MSEAQINSLVIALVGLIVALTQAISWYAHDRHAREIERLAGRTSALEVKVNGKDVPANAPTT